MFDIGWSEMAIVMVVALIVIGPKDLPKVARTIGQWTGKARAMARDFQRSLDEMAREAELDDIKKSIDKARPGNIRRSIEDAIDPDRSLTKAFDVDAPDPVTAANERDAKKRLAAAKKVEERAVKTPTEARVQDGGEDVPSAAPAADEPVRQAESSSPPAAPSS